MGSLFDKGGGGGGDAAMQQSAVQKGVSPADVTSLLGMLSGKGDQFAEKPKRGAAGLEAAMMQAMGGMGGGTGIPTAEEEEEEIDLSNYTNMFNGTRGTI